MKSKLYPGFDLALKEDHTLQWAIGSKSQSEILTCRWLCRFPDAKLPDWDEKSFERGKMPERECKGSCDSVYVAANLATVKGYLENNQYKAMEVAKSKSWKLTQRPAHVQKMLWPGIEEYIEMRFQGVRNYKDPVFNLKLSDLDYEMFFTYQNSNRTMISPIEFLQLEPN